ncbi:GIY-YIG nuclease family protein [Hyphobacterium sp.]|uniref:GIY-YIG nuclease family protein n=1 Tax=Hyphobacterium sp. TaxID=2004662 RepID=UPI003749F962
MSRRHPFVAVYMLASRKDGPIYTGATNDLNRRVYEHQAGLIHGFTKRYNCTLLVWYEAHTLMAEAIRRERRLKKYSRQWKINLIEAQNPDWRDLTETLWHS